MRILSLLMLSLMAGNALANQGDQLTALQNQLEEKSSVYAPSIQAAYQNQLNQVNGYQTVMTALNNNATNQLSNVGQSQQDKAAHGVMVFVSLGMPADTLRDIFRQAHQLGIPVVVRGALDNNFQESAKVLFNVLHPQNQPVIPGGLTIDPLWFRSLGITQVPAVVAISPNNTCTSDKCTPDFDVVYGNISIPAALKKIAEQGDAAPEVAKRLLP